MPSYPSFIFTSLLVLSFLSPAPKALGAALLRTRARAHAHTGCQED